MKENIETKDVQRTEYLDKNGLDMLWAKVKENTHNQVEVERNRAVAKENSITNSLSEFVSKTATDAQSLKSELSVSNSLHIIDGSNTDSHTTITCDGISNTDNNANHVYATNGSIADLTQYAKKSEITAGGNVDDVQVNGVTVVENKIANIKPATKENLGVVKVGDGLNVTDGTISVDSTALTALEQKVTANTTAISAKQDAGNYIPYETSSSSFYNLNTGIKFVNEDDSIKTLMNNYFVEVAKGDNSTIIRGDHISLMNVFGAKIQLDTTKGSIIIYKNTSQSRVESLILLEDGIKLHGGDNNHVLTSNASTIDITQYVLKSVYDEKIAALEARIAALEAKHTETA